MGWLYEWALRITRKLTGKPNKTWDFIEVFCTRLFEAVVLLDSSGRVLVQYELAFCFVSLSPFEVLYGHSPWSLGTQAADACAIPDLQDWLQERELMLDLVIKQHLSRAQERMKHQADKHHSERVFNEGDMVFLKLQP